jgi:hypothetical protein
VLAVTTNGGFCRTVGQFDGGEERCFSSEEHIDMIVQAQEAQRLPLSPPTP